MDSTSDEDRWAALVAREARGEELTPEEDELRRRFEEEHPEAAAERGLWEGLGGLGDPRDGVAEMSDAAMLERVLAKHREASPPARARPLLRRGVAGAFAGVALAAALVLAVAAELVGPFGKSAPERPDQIEETPAPKGHAAPPLQGPADAVIDAGADAAVTLEEAREEAEATTTAPPDLAAPLRPADSRQRDSSFRDLRGAPAPESADDLLKSAQVHLGEGRTSSAISAYKQLLARYPGSVEARVALVSLGQLSLGGGDAAGALTYFDRYLAGSGPLGMEARLGRIQALRRLGRTGDELAAIHDFLARYPDSVHAPRLRSRLDANP
jgi:tetratricopeptide (TPR) repeat protein